jgi:hypothetical protein
MGVKGSHSIAAAAPTPISAVRRAAPVKSGRCVAITR